MSRLTLREMVEQLNQANEDANVAISGVPQQTLDLFASANFQRIVALLMEQPLLVAPCKAWLETKRAEMARAQLTVLYTPEELNAMYAAVQEEKH